MSVTAPSITDGPVTLRHPQESDVQGSWEQCQDPLSIQWTTVPVPFSHADARDFVLGFVPRAWDDDTEWGFVVEAEGRYAGHITLRNERNGRAELAYGSHPWVRGTGHMEHAIRMLLDWGFREKRLETVIWLANVGNWASRRLAWKVGFTFGGILPRWLPHRGELRDAWTGTLLREDPREPRTRWLDQAVLEGSGVRLRPFRESDAERVVEACSDERTRHWLGELPSPYTLDDALAFIAGRTGLRASGKGLSWAVADPETDLLLGSVGLFDLPDDLARGEVGYWAHPDARGRGVMTAAVRAVLGHAFEALDLQVVFAFAAVGNHASGHVLAGSGLTEHGLERSLCLTADGRVDGRYFDMTREEWLSR
jgi:RimJ/RimL family protein N-acetyltransferase